MDAVTGDVLHQLDSWSLPEEVKSYSGLNSLHFTPDGSKLLIQFYAWNVVMDVSTGRELASFGSIEIGNNVSYNIQGMDLQTDKICFVLRPAMAADAPIPVIGSLDLDTFELSTVYTGETGEFVESSNCSPNGRYYSFTSYHQDDSAYSFQIIDLDTGEAVIDIPQGAGSNSPPHGYFSKDSKNFTLLTGTYLAMIDLDARQIRYSEPFQQWHWNFGAFGTLYTPPHGHVAQTASGKSVEKIQQVALPPKEILNLAMESLPPGLREEVRSARPTIPN